MLIAGRIVEHVEASNLTVEVIKKFSSLHPTDFYFMDEKTQEVIVTLHSFNGGNHYRVFKRKEHAHLMDYVVTIGGDGTILYAAKEFENTSPPFLTFHQGTLGFLCKFRVEELSRTIDKAVLAKLDKNNAHFKERKLMRIQASIYSKGEKVPKEEHVLLNEIALTR